MRASSIDTRSRCARRLAQKLLAAPSAEARAADRFGRRLEESAEAAELEIWSELRAGQDSL